MVHRVTMSSISSGGGLLPKLKHLCLHELPKLYGIVTWTVRRLLEPNLETVKIRGCWSLTELPLIHSNKVVSCDCEKEWWDNLDWDFREQSSYYKPIHSRHYKKR